MEGLVGEKHPFQIKCLNCGEEQYARYFPRKIKNREATLYNVQETPTVGDVGRVYAILNPYQVKPRAMSLGIGKGNNDSRDQLQRMGKGPMDFV